MSNYVKNTNYAVKDGYTTGDSRKTVKGTELDGEFNDIADAIASKADTSSPTFTGTPLAPTASTGTNTTQIATTAFVTAAVDDATGTISTQNANNVDITGGTVANTAIKNYTESVVAIGTVTSSNTLSLTNGTVQTATLTASTACTFTMPTAVAGKSFVLLLKQAASTGNGTATFTGVKWSVTGTPVVTATAGKMDIFSFFSDGTNWYGSYTQGYTP